MKTLYSMLADDARHHRYYLSQHMTSKENDEHFDFKYLSDLVGATTPEIFSCTIGMVIWLVQIDLEFFENLSTSS
jgi:hypothetical protein